MDPDGSIEFSSDLLSKFKHLDNYDQSLETFDKKFSYGTCGFRYNESELDKISFRLAILTCFRSKFLEGLPLGIMMTASHNKHTDNGLKVICQNGEYFERRIELIYEDFINTKEFVHSLKKIIENMSKEASSRYFFRDNTARICLGHDTRRSCERLKKHLLYVFDILGCDYVNYSVITTPQLHWLTYVNQINYRNNKFQIFVKEDLYWNWLQSTYDCFYEMCDRYSINMKGENYERELLIDCSCGASSPKVEYIKQIFEKRNLLKLNFINNDFSKPENLNHECGAEHVHKYGKLPISYDKIFSKNVSFDGDVDRLIYYTVSQDRDMKIISGDRLITLYSLFFNKLINSLSLSLQKEFRKQIRIGVVSTAYSNGAFMKFIKETLGLELAITKTGVKHLHPVAKTFDIGIYFESNGHGTIVYSQELIKDKLTKMDSLCASSRDAQMLELLQVYLSMFNITCGDSISDLISIECSLNYLNINLSYLYNTYKDLYSKNTTIKVLDKNIFHSNHDETRLIEPACKYINKKDLQKVIDEVCMKYENARSFVRASGTEDLVRIYVESGSLDDTEIITKHIYDFIQKNYS